MDETGKRQEQNQAQVPGHEKEQERLERNGRRYSVANQRGNVRSKFRYIESNHPSAGCRFL